MCVNSCSVELWRHKEAPKRRGSTDFQVSRSSNVPRFGSPQVDGFSYQTFPSKRLSCKILMNKQGMRLCFLCFHAACIVILIPAPSLRVMFSYVSASSLSVF
ncbi:hypothetical protein AMECASPLE_015999 [Ameca splendens]|uniref:Uncharacterized protein n=1 Tax=Ameca splendens TaxID=208324 RepID=A0ABV0ZN45_9TELE